MRSKRNKSRFLGGILRKRKLKSLGVPQQEKMRCILRKGYAFSVFDPCSKEGGICFPALYAALLAGKSCITAQAKALKHGKRFVCYTAMRKGKEFCATHFICIVVLQQGGFAHMRMKIAYVANHEEPFRKASRPWA